MSVLSSGLLPHIVIDMGSSTIKCGFNGESCPRLIIPNVIGKHKKSQINIIESPGKVHFGYDALANSSILDLEYPKISHNGKTPITDIDELNDWEGMFKYIFEKGLKVKQDNYNVFIIDSLFTTKQERWSIASILYEKCEIYNLHFEPQSVMTWYSTAKSSGLIIDSGEIMTEIVPIYEGYIIPQGVLTSPLAGKEITTQFIKHYKKTFDHYGVTSQYETAKNIKEMYCEVLPKEGISEKKNVKFEWPDGNKIDIGSERYDIPELFFDPETFGNDLPSLQELLMKSIDRIDIIQRKVFWNSIVWGGGNTMMKGFGERLKQEFKWCWGDKYSDNNSSGCNVKIQSFPERKYSAWIGASGVCSFGQFHDKWISKSEYADIGKSLFTQNYWYD